MIESPNDLEIEDLRNWNPYLTIGKMKPELKYIDLKSGFGDNGPAWIGMVEFSKTGRTVYFNGKALKNSNALGIS